MTEKEEVRGESWQKLGKLQHVQLHMLPPTLKTHLLDWNSNK